MRKDHQYPERERERESMGNLMKATIESSKNNISRIRGECPKNEGLSPITILKHFEHDCP